MCEPYLLQKRKEAIFNMDDTLQTVNKSRPEDQFTQDRRKGCKQIARELRVIGDALETRPLQLEGDPQDDNERMSLQYITCLKIIKGSSLLLFFL